ncbi:hypothetical protein [Laspinema palackyanum]|uniref:hypothetical protein n=1 Tax=Laspinema palackyanum TaxID=3231601 RepID=UPI00349F4517
MASAITGEQRLKSLLRTGGELTPPQSEAEDEQNVCSNDFSRYRVTGPEPSNAPMEAIAPVPKQADA